MNWGIWYLLTGLFFTLSAIKQDIRDGMSWRSFCENKPLVRVSISIIFWPVLLLLLMVS